MTDCTICHDQITEATGFTKLSCHHTYHLGCIVKWLLINETCPCCRKNTTEYEIVKQKIYSIEEYEIIGYDSTEDNEFTHFDNAIQHVNVQLTLPPAIARLTF